MRRGPLASALSARGAEPTKTSPRRAFRRRPTSAVANVAKASRLRRFDNDLDIDGLIFFGHDKPSTLHALDRDA